MKSYLPQYKSKLWYNINIYDPISVKNIFKGIIEKTTDEKRKEKVIDSYKYVMSSRPRTWCDDGIDKMSRLMTFASNGGKIYEELIKNKKANTKLKKYDKIIKRHIKQNIEEAKYCSAPIVNTGMNSDIRKFLNKIMYG